MGILDTLATNHHKWVQLARSICKDHYLADDLVSEMYIKLSEETRALNTGYIYKTMFTLFIDHIREQRQFSAINEDTFEVIPDDAEPISLPMEVLECLSWPEKQILILRQTQSGREIEKQYHINYQKVHRIENRAKQKIKEWAKKSEDLAM